MTDSAGTDCPACGATLGGARVCPECGLEIRNTADELTDEAVNAVVDDALAQAGGITPDSGGVVPYPVRLAVALAITVPFAPLAAFVLTSVVAVHPIAVIVVGMIAWMAPAAVLASAAVPSLIVGRGLVVLGTTVALAPPLVAVGRAMAGADAVADPAIDASQALLGSFLLFGAAILGLGLLVARLAIRKRDAWAEQSPHDPVDRF